MKQKITRIVLSLATVMSFSLVAVPVGAQGVVEVGPTATPPPVTTPAPTAADTTGGKGAGVPATGVAPQSNRVALATLIFLGGSAAGAALGFGVVQLRRSRNSL